MGTGEYVGDFQANKRKKEISGRWITMHKTHKGVNNYMKFQKLQIIIHDLHRRCV